MLLRLVASLVFLATLPVVAHADMEVAMQDDLTIVHGNANRDLALEQFKRMGGTHVRINLEHSRSSDTRNQTGADATRLPLELYVGAVEAIRDHGLEPQVTLIWKRQQDAFAIAEWTRSLAEHFGSDVGRYSILNEPDLLLEATCGPNVKTRFAERYADQVVRNKHGNPRAKVKTPQKLMNLKLACIRYRRGKLYKTIVDQVERGIHKGNPQAEILAGETSAQPGLEWFVRGAQPREMQIDGWAHHPFQLSDLTPRMPSITRWGIGSLELLKRTVRVPIFLTEFGYPHPNSSMDKRVFGYHLKPRQLARALPLAWQLARDAGARQMLQYQWFVKPHWRTEFWETALLRDDDGRVTPAYRALRRYIRSWD